MIKTTMLILLISSPILSWGAITVTPAIINFDSSNATKKTLQLYNHDQQPHRVTMVLNELKRPGTRSEKVIQLPTKQRALKITPNPITLSANEKRSIILENKKKLTDSDQLYLLDVTITDKPNTATPKGVSINIQYGARIIIRPQTPRISINLSQNNGQLRIKNKGNTTVLLTNGQQCHSKQHCVPLPIKRLYAGNTWQLSTLYRNDPTYYYVHYLGKKIPIDSLNRNNVSYISH